MVEGAIFAMKMRAGGRTAGPMSFGLHRFGIPPVQRFKVKYFPTMPDSVEDDCHLSVNFL
jgi:hypothetical protein